jgi:aspartate/methionine/tyrosine aminotransferase
MIPNDVKVIDLGQGEVFFHPPAEALEKLDWQRVHGYCPDQGLLEFRERIASSIFPDLTAGNVLITSGANCAFFNLMTTVLTPGQQEEVILPSPVYFNHAMAVEILGGKVIEIPCNSDFSLDIETMREKVTPKTKVIVITTPNNPTGKVYEHEQLVKVIEICLENDLMLVADETYANSLKFVYDDVNYYSPFQIARDKGVEAVSISSFSKTYGIPGWRLGYLITPSEELMTEILKVQDTGPICAPVPAQILACELIDNWQDYFHGHLKEIKKRKEAIELPLREFLSYEPNGALYIFPHFKTKTNTYQQALNLAAEKGIIVLPGSVFGKAGEGHFRIAYGNVSVEQLGMAGERVKAFLLENIN